MNILQKRRQLRFESLEAKRVLATLSIIPIEDGMVIDSAPVDQVWDAIELDQSLGDNNPNTASAIGMHEIHPANMTSDATRGVIEFDISSLPNNVDSVILDLDFNAVQSQRVLGVYAYAGDGAVSVADAAEIDAQNLIALILGQDIVDDFDPNRGLFWNLDVTSEVTQLAGAGEDFMTIGLRAQSQGHQWRIQAIERGLGTPRLIVNYDAEPVVDDASFGVDENVPAGTPVGVVQASGDSALTLDIVGGNTDGAFMIDNSGQITVANAAAIDFEANPVFTLTVQATDGNSLVGQGTITVNLNDLPDQLTPEEQIGAIANVIADLRDEGNLGNGEANPVLNHLKQALKSLGKGKPAKAIQKLEQARDEIQELIDDGDLSAAIGDSLVAQINGLVAELQ